MKLTIRILLTGFVTLLLSSVSYAGPLGWSISGPGTVSATQNGVTDWDLDYYLNPAGFSPVTWNVTSSVVDQAGDYTFDWNYSGFHAFFGVTAFLNTSDLTTLVNAGPANCCTDPSDSFSYSGTYTFTGLNVGDVIGFSMGGGNFDSNNQLGGTLNLVQTSSVPEPESLLILSLGLLSLGLRRRVQG